MFDDLKELINTSGSELQQGEPVQIDESGNMKSPGNGTFTTLSTILADAREELGDLAVKSFLLAYLSGMRRME